MNVAKRFLILSFVLCVIFISNGSAQQADQKMLPLHIELGPMSILRMPSWVALGEGIYKKNGLDVDQCHTEITVSHMKEVGLQPPSDMYMCPKKSKPAPAASDGAAGAMPAFLSNAAGNPIIMSGGFASFMEQVLNPQAERRAIILSTSNVTNWKLFVRKGITSPEQLKGGRIAVLSFTDIHGFMAMAFIEAMGWDPRSDVTFVFEWGPPAFKDLQNGKIDAMIANDTPELLAERAGYKPLVDLGQWKIPMASAGANVDIEWLKNNRETARRFVKSQVEARALMEDRNVVNRTLAKYFGVTDPKLQEVMYAKLVTMPRKPYPSKAGLLKATKLYDSFYPQLRQLRVEEFIDDSFVRELDQSGYIDSLYKK